MCIDATNPTPPIIPLTHHQLRKECNIKVGDFVKYNTNANTMYISEITNRIIPAGFAVADIM